MKHLPEIVGAVFVAALIALFAFIWTSAPCGLWQYSKAGDMPGRCINK